MKKIKVQMVGNYYVKEVKNRLPDYVCVQNIVTNISPLTMFSPCDEETKNQWENIIMDLSNWKEKPSNAIYEKQEALLFDIRKNFKDVLKRTSEQYCDNQVFTHGGQEVIYMNEAEFIIVDNSSLVYSLAKYNNTYYTYFSKTTPFYDFFKTNTNVKIINPEETVDFNWKFFYDCFINALLEEYENSQIILIKTPCNRFYFNSEKNTVEVYEFYNNAKANFIKEVDNYFATKSGCHVIDTLELRISNLKSKYAWPYGTELGQAYNLITNEIVQIINGNVDVKNTSNKFNCSLANFIYNKVNKNHYQDTIAFFDFIENKRIVSVKKILFDDRILSLFNKDFHVDLFLDALKINNLFEYIKQYLVLPLSNDLQESIINAIQNYTKFFEIDINELLSIYQLYLLCENKARFKVIAENIINGSSSFVKFATDKQEKNLNFLKTYPYIDHSLLSNIDLFDKLYCSICDNAWIVIDKNSNQPFDCATNLVKNYCNIDEIISNNYDCSIKEADALTFSYEYYIEKAKIGDGNKPTFLTFYNMEDFVTSLKFIDYTELLSNEKFIFKIGDNCSVDYTIYQPTVNFTELIESETVMINVTAGLTDQICYYILGQVIQDFCNKKVIYDDAHAFNCFNGFEIEKFSKKPLRLFSNYLSQRIKQIAERKKINIQRAIDENFVYLTHDYKRYEKVAKGENCIILRKNYKQLLNINFSHLYIDCLIRPEDLQNYFDFELKNYVLFPPILKKSHIELIEEMEKCNSVAIHIRCGDYITIGANDDYDYFCYAINIVLHLKQYQNKKFFIFSDDIEFCKDNCEKIGISQIADSEIIFVEGNKGEESFRDMQLMTHAKIMIVCKSGFSRFAAIYNENCDVIICNKNHLNLPKFKFDEYVLNETAKILIRKSIDSTIKNLDVEKLLININGKNAKENSKGSMPPRPQTKNDSFHVANSNNAGGGIITGREYIEWLNFWFDNANEKRNDRILLIGDSVARDYRGPLAQLTKKPVDFFATTTNISDDQFYKTLDLFFSYEEYRQCKAHIQIGVHGIDGFGKAIQSNSIDEFEKAYEKLVTYILKYIPDLTIALTTSVVKQGNLSELDEKINNEIIKRNQVAKKIAEKYKLKVNDLYSFMLNELHRDCVHFPKEGSEKIARKVAEVMKLI